MLNPLVDTVLNVDFLVLFDFAFTQSDDVFTNCNMLLAFQ